MVDDDLFAAFSEPGDSGEDADPFASLDSSETKDPFASLGFDEEDDGLFAPVPPEEPPIVLEEPEWESVVAEEPPPPTDADERPEWLRELGGFEEEGAGEAVSAPLPEPTRQRRSGLLSGLVGSGPDGMALGMTAQQRMILSVFLFLDIAVLACMILIAIGAVNIGLP